tara:strand:- start:1036 stop:1140 length:105 start_codon:yes stop_codon:yes gene_type:complete
MDFIIENLKIEKNIHLKKNYSVNLTSDGKNKKYL